MIFCLKQAFLQKNQQIILSFENGSLEKNSKYHNNSKKGLVSAIHNTKLWSGPTIHNRSFQSELFFDSVIVKVSVFSVFST